MSSPLYEFVPAMLTINNLQQSVLTWISIYWFSRAGPAASTRIYYEAGNALRAAQEPPVKSVPMGVSIFPKELAVVPKA